MKRFYCLNHKKGWLGWVGTVGEPSAVAGPHCAHNWFSSKWYRRLWKKKIKKVSGYKVYTVVGREQERTKVQRLISSVAVAVLSFTRTEGMGKCRHRARKWTVQSERRRRPGETEWQLCISDVYFGKSDQINPSFSGAQQEVHSGMFALCPRWCHHFLCA